MDGHKSRVFSACFNPRSAHELISGGWDNTIQFWDTRQPYALRRISGVHMCGDGLDISRNGRETLAMIRNLRGGTYSLDIGPVNPKHAKKTRTISVVPQLAFCAGKRIFEIDAQPS
ncbi:uncharacterized protein isoform X3 [Bombus fervidus]|uniref:uncharacterized protein isoform X3 n=1 Tax=Bombus fervidus TaxID=203811 RepID=UPI003D187A2C